MTNPCLSVELPYFLVHSECVSVLSMQQKKKAAVKRLEIPIKLINRRWGGNPSNQLYSESSYLQIINYKQ